jgi:hypothetical protein
VSRLIADTLQNEPLLSAHSNRISASLLLFLDNDTALGGGGRGKQTCPSVYLVAAEKSLQID